MEPNDLPAVEIRAVCSDDLTHLAEFIEPFVGEGKLLPRTREELNELVVGFGCVELDHRRVDPDGRRQSRGQRWRDHRARAMNSERFSENFRRMMVRTRRSCSALLMNRQVGRALRARRRVRSAGAARRPHRQSLGTWAVSRSIWNRELSRNYTVGQPHSGD